MGLGVWMEELVRMVVSSWELNDAEREEMSCF
jgi:hypothetical protein